MLLDSSVPFDTFDIIFMDLSVPFENDTLTYTEDQTFVCELFARSFTKECAEAVQ